MKKMKSYKISVEQARQTMINAFEKDFYFRSIYIDNIAMLLNDRYNMTDRNIRNQAANDIMTLIFK